MHKITKCLMIILLFSSIIMFSSCSKKPKEIICEYKNYTALENNKYDGYITILMSEDVRRVEIKFSITPDNNYKLKFEYENNDSISFSKTVNSSVICSCLKPGENELKVSVDQYPKVKLNIIIYAQLQDQPII